GGKNGADAWNLGDGVGVLQAFQRFNHQDQNDVVVDRVAVAARHAAPHVLVEGLAATVASPAERWKVRPIPRFNRLFDAVHGGDDDPQPTGVERVLNLALVRVGHSNARNRLRLRTGTPHSGSGLPVALVVLHLGPDEVVAGVSHGTVSGGIGRAEERSAGHLSALLQLELHRIPNLRVFGWVEGRSVLPGRRIERTLIYRSRWRGRERLAFLAVGE